MKWKIEAEIRIWTLGLESLDTNSQTPQTPNHSLSIKNSIDENIWDKSSYSEKNLQRQFPSRIAEYQHTIDLCICFTVGTNGGTADGEPCAFPFIYNSQTHTECIGSGRLWCSTTANYDEDRKWGYCAGVEIIDNIFCDSFLVIIRLSCIGGWFPQKLAESQKVKLFLL